MIPSFIVVAALFIFCSASISATTRSVEASDRSPVVRFPAGWM